MLSAYAKRGFLIEDYPNSYNYYKSMVTLPLYSTLTDEQVDYIISCVRDILKYNYVKEMAVLTTCATEQVYKTVLRDFKQKEI